MGSNKKKPQLRSSKCSSKSRFPLGELSRQKADLRDQYLSKNKGLCVLKKKIKRLQEKNSENIQQCMKQLEVTPVQSRSSVLKYGKINDVSKYFSSSKKLKKAALMKIKLEAQNYEKSDENFICSLSLLYAGGVIGNVKHEQGRSALVMKHTGKTIKKGTPSKQRITFGFGIPIPRPLAYKELMHNIPQVDIGELICVRDTLCTTLPPEKRVAGVYRELETMLLNLSKFYLEKDPIRKDSEKLIWFSEKDAIGGDGAPFGKWDQSMSWLVSFLNVCARVASPKDITKQRNTKKAKQRKEAPKHHV